VKVLTTKEVADYLRCHVSTVYRMAQSNQIPAFRIGSDWRFEQSALETWLRTKLDDLHPELKA
jgi:excisionase family DNA binding protein